MSHIRLFEHPANRDHFLTVPALAITGALPAASPSLAYEGRLTIVNLGTATAEVIEVVGTLPPGSTVTVDNTTDKVVVAWPAYEVEVAPIPNADFELGDTQWIKGPGWSIVQNDVNDDPNTTSSQWTAKYADQGGNVELRNAVRVAVTAGQSITASCRVQQGASSEGNAGAAVRLFFQPVSGAEVMREGNLVDSGSNSQWRTSTLNTTAPFTGTVQIGCRGKRHRQNKPLWVDNFAWNATLPSVGHNSLDAIGPITIRIRDTLGRVAEWTGSIVVAEPDAILADNPIAYWKLNETSGAVIDHSGNERHLTVTGSPGRTANGIHLTALAQGAYYPGSGAGSVFDTGVDLAWATCAVIEREGNGGGVFQWIAGQWTSTLWGRTNHFLALMGDGAGPDTHKPQGGFHESGGLNRRAATGPTAVPVGERMLLHIVREPVGGGNADLVLYKNGVEIGRYVAGNEVGVASAGLKYLIGSDADAAAYYPSSYGFLGYIAHVAEFDHSLTPERVMAHAVSLGFA